MSFTTRPTRFGGGVSLLVGGFAVAALATVPVAAAAGGVGVLSLVVGTVRDLPRLRSIGAGGLLAGLLLAGAFGASAAVLVVAAVAGVVAWDAADNAASVGAQMGAAATTTRAELSHLSATVVVACSAGGIAYVAARFVDTQRPLEAVVLLLLGATALASAMR